LFAILFLYMKTYIRHFAHKINFWNLFVGIVIGFGVGILVINALVPNANDMIRLYRLDKKSMTENKVSHESHNPYLMGNVTSEKQFVEEMIKHHQAAVVMAQQVLALNPRSEVLKLAKDIISAQSTEIKMMQEWLANWR
jgi:hypothetical protein